MSRFVSSGRRIHQVQVQNNVPASNTDGDFVDDWTTIAAPMALVEAMSARSQERSMAGTVTAYGTHTITIPFVAGVISTSRVVFGARIFSVVSVPRNTGEANVELVLDCVETESQTS